MKNGSFTANILSLHKATKYFAFLKKVLVHMVPDSIQNPEARAAAASTQREVEEHDKSHDEQMISI